jgi:signal transduction histidine kinase
VYATIKHRLFNIKVIATELLVFLLWIFIIVKALIATTPNEKISEVILLLITVIIGIFLIRSVLKEVEAREEIERLAKDLSSANARLKELDKLKSEFVSIASHQLRSPLTAIKGYASLIKDGSFGKVSPGVGEAIDKIFQSSQALVAMVEDFLNISRIEQGRMKFEFESFDLKTLAVEIIDELKPTVERAGLTLSLSTDHQEPYAIKADRNKIRQIINNLIDNAIKYTPKGSISVTLSRRPNRNKILIAIADTGIGIDAETIPHLFEKFSRAKDANKVNVIGTGLGLYIVKEIVNGHHGRVWVESSGKGSGSTFFVELDEDSTVIHATRVADFAKTM